MLAQSNHQYLKWLRCLAIIILLNMSVTEDFIDLNILIGVLII